MNETHRSTPIASRIAFEGLIFDALTHVLGLLPGAEITARINPSGWHLRQLVRVLTPAFPSEALELAGFADGEDSVHLGVVTVSGLPVALLAERRA